MTRPLRVALDVTPLAGPPSGVHQVTRGLLHALTQRTDVAVHGWMLSARGPAADVDVAVHRSHLPARWVHRLWSRSSVPPARLVAGAADVVHGTNFITPPGRRAVVSVQDLSLVRHPDWCRPEVAAMAGPLRHAVRRGATVHVSCHAVADEVIAELGAHPDRVVVVHHAVTPIGPGETGLGKALARHDRYVLVLGTVEHRKDVHVVTDAVAALPPDVGVVIAGPAGNAEHRLPADRDRVVRLPAVDDHTRAALLRDASVLAYPSRYEGFGLPPLEALSVGTPVVATAVGALPELVGDLVDLAPPGDPADFTARLVAALERPQPVPPGATERIASMTWERAGAAMVDLYRRVAGSDRR